MIQKKAYFSDMNSKTKKWVRESLQEYLKTLAMRPFAWLHPDILHLYKDNLFDPVNTSEDVISGTRSILTGLLEALPSSNTSHIEGIPLPLFYDRMAREISQRIRSMWLKSKSSTSQASKHKLQQYIMAMTECVCEQALFRHTQLTVVAIELGILSMILASMQKDTVSPLQILRDRECYVCKMRGYEYTTHRKVISMILRLYQNQEDVNLQSVTDSPQSSPLCALSAEGLDLGHTFLLVSKMMQWHDLALPEAQALSVCSEWLVSTEMPCTADFFKKLSALQTKAEDRAIKNMYATNSKKQSNYIYDDVMDAWVCVKSNSDANTDNLSAVTGDQPAYMKSHDERPMHHLVRQAVEISSPCEEDEIDFLSKKSPIRSSRVCRKVQRLDVGKEARRQTRARHRRRQAWIPYL